MLVCHPAAPGDSSSPTPADLHYLGRLYYLCHGWEVKAKPRIGGCVNCRSSEKMPCLAEPSWLSAFNGRSHFYSLQRGASAMRKCWLSADETGPSCDANTELIRIKNPREEKKNETNCVLASIRSIWNHYLMGNGTRNAASDVTSKGHSLLHSKVKGQSQTEGGSKPTPSITYSADHCASQP